MNNKIRVLFLINEKFINNFEIVYKKMKKNKLFEVNVVACESKSTDYKCNYSSKEIYDFLNQHNIKCIDSYNPITKQYLDLNQFNPDYIFVSTPYDIYRPKEYSSLELSKIAKVCDIEYGTAVVFDDNHNMNILENEYYVNCYMHFITNNIENYISADFDNSSIKKKFIPIGCAKVEKFLSKGHSSNNWYKIFEKKQSLRIVWKPRWVLENPNVFFDWLENFIKMSYEEDIQLLILEHPLFRSNLKNKKLLKKYIKELNKIKNNIKIYNDYDFLDFVLESDVLVCEPSSLIAEYSITNNPIILNGEYEKINGIGKKIINKEWIAKDFETVYKLLKQCKHNKIIKYKNKYFYEDKKKIATSVFLIDLLKEDNKNNPTTNYIRDYIKKQDELLQGINKILQQGYYEKNIISYNNETAKNIDRLIKKWADEITLLKSK